MTKPIIQSENIYIGKNVVIHPTAVIRGVSGHAKNISIGDNTYIGENVQILCDDISIGDYSKIHHHTNVHGYRPCKIGHNAWIGQYTIIDSIGGTTIGNNCGVGAHSQLWSHIKFGDTLEGCRFLSEKNLKIGNDVWFVGHCIVSPIVAEDKSMAMVGSVVTKDMQFNRIYAGTPAKDITEKTGRQFEDVSIIKKYDKLKIHLNEFGKTDSIKIVYYKDEVDFQDNFTYFVINDRKYKKTRSEIEIAFMKYLLPEKAKFTPYE
jgi:acetyltransferase-like isoleucine patch superfamily enzyme